SFSHDGLRIVTASKDKTARLWKAAIKSPPESVSGSGPGGSRVIILNGHEAAVNSACFSPDDSRIVTASDDHTARLWDGVTGSPIAILRGHEDSVAYACFSPD